MFNLKKVTEPSPDSVIEREFALLQMQPSEGIIKRDSFFHSCWVLLKHKRPDLAFEMNECELNIAGYYKEPEDEKPDEDKKPDGHIM